MRKFKHIKEVENWEVLTPSGYKPVSKAMLTEPYDEYKLTTVSDKTLHAADDHIVILEDGSECFMRDLESGMRVKCEKVPEIVEHCVPTGSTHEMYDFEVPDGHVYYTDGILSHNTTTSAAYLLHQAITRPNITIAILANKGSTAAEILERIKFAYENLPWFLQVGVKTWNKSYIELGNGSKIITAATSSSSIRGKSINILFLDEFGFVENQVEFYTSTYPVISAGKTTQVIITSTPHGLDLFYKIWTDAEEGRNKFKTVGYDWTVVPGRDEKWKEETLANTSPVQFAQEYECVDGDTIVTIEFDGIEQDITIENLFKFESYDRYLIKTPHGFEKFDDVITKKANTLRITFKDGSGIVVTHNHRFFIYDMWEFAEHLEVGEILNGKEIVKIEENGICDVYDVVNTESHSYITNGVVSHNCSFLGSSNTLIAGWKLQQLAFKEPEQKDEHWSIYNKPQPGHNYCMTVDVAEGLGQDYAVISIFDVTEMPYKHVAVFRNNLIQPIGLAEVVYKAANEYNEAYILVENNSIGKIVADSLYYDYEYENMFSSVARNGETDVSFSGKTPGIRTTAKTKALGCSQLKSLIENDGLITHDFNAVSELSTFSQKGRTFRADNGKHDDVVMTMVMFAWFTAQPFFEDMFDVNVRKALRESMDVDSNIGFMFFDDGINDDEPVVDMFN